MVVDGSAVDAVVVVAVVVVVVVVRYTSCVYFQTRAWKKKKRDGLGLEERSGVLQS